MYVRFLSILYRWKENSNFPEHSSGSVVYKMSSTNQIDEDIRLEDSVNLSDVYSNPAVTSETAEYNTTDQHSYNPHSSSNRAAAFARHLNTSLQPDSHFPLPLGLKDLFEALNDGIVYIQLVGLVSPGVLSTGIMHKGRQLNVLQKLENLSAAIMGAKAIGCQVANITADDLLQGR